MASIEDAQGEYNTQAHQKRWAMRTKGIKRVSPDWRKYLTHQDRMAYVFNRRCGTGPNLGNRRVQFKEKPWLDARTALDQRWISIRAKYDRRVSVGSESSKVD